MVYNGILMENIGISVMIYIVFFSREHMNVISSIYNNINTTK